jgi:glycosyltransferase involved in cell wall biosynthesis
MPGHGFGSEGSQVLSICIGHSNRTSLLKECVRSLNTAISKLRVEAELVICDYDGQVASWIFNESKLPVRIVTLSGPYNRGKARNTAAENSQGDWLYFCDADMVTPPEVLRDGFDAIRTGRALFPQYRRYKSAEQKDWFWGTGHGNCICRRDHWKQSGGYPEKQEYGGEDTAFANWFRVKGLLVRKQYDNYYHLWHPSK